MNTPTIRTAVATAAPRDRASRRFRLRALLAGIAIGAAAVLGTAIPASAHDELLSSTPAANATIDAAPAEVVLTFSGNILPQTAIMAITDAAGTDYRQGEPKVSETSVTVGLKPGLPGGAYEIRWAVTSEDGHPISGIIPFSIAGSGASEPSAAPVTPTAAPSAADTAAPTDANAPVASPPAEESGVSAGLVIALVVTGVAVVGLVVVIAVVMARRRGQDGNAPTDDSGL
ncbi:MULTISPECIES: copper resistance CopC family protein [Bacteria]|uniref:copper resistance CopC family protein n=1 Tax=Bacteria TaxID=2 RepID=UPI003C7A6CDD